MGSGKDTVAIVNGDRGRTAIWHVDIGPAGMQMNRLAGAWVADNSDIDGWLTPNRDGVFPHLLVGRQLVPYAGTLPAAIQPYRDLLGARVDLQQTRVNVIQWRDECNERHSACLTKAGKPRMPIDWPEIPPPIEWKAMRESGHASVDDTLIAETIGLARWVGQLADAWNGIENERLARPHLCGRFPALRPMPVISPEAAAR